MRSVLPLLAICVCVGAEGAHAQGAKPVSEDQTLKGYTSMSVSAVVEGTKEITSTMLRTELERRLRENGITVLPSGYPQLAVTLSTLFTGAPTRYVVFTLNMDLKQALPLPAFGAPGAVADATTWSRGTFGIFEAIEIEKIRTSVENLTGAFLGSFLTANPAVAKTVNNARSRIDGVGRGVLGNFPDDRVNQEAATKHLQDVQSRNQQVITCSYGEPGRIYEYTFWYRTPPEGIRQILKSLRGGDDHPFWTLGVNAVTTCPPTRDTARKALQDSRSQ